MPVPAKMADLFTIASSNSPAGSEAIGNSLDDYLRALAAIMRSTNAVSSFTLASASTTDLGTADAEHVQVTGTATISSFGTSVSGLIRECRFAGALTITASSNIVLPNSADIAVAAGDVLTFRSMGGGVWRLVSATNAPTATSAAKLTTARTISLGGLLGGSASFDGSGNVTITATMADGALSIAKTSGLQTALDGKLSTGGGTISSGTLTINQPGSSGTGLMVTGSTLAGAGILLTGNGSTTPSKTIAVRSGSLGIYSDGGSKIFGLADDGSAQFPGSVQIGGGKTLSKITVSSSAPGTLADGELYLQY